MRPEEIRDIEEEAIEYLREEVARRQSEHLWPTPPILAFSGGKDSTVIYQIAKKAGVAVAPRYNVTTIDPPPLLQHMRRAYPEVEWRHPQRGMWRLMLQEGYPSRTARWCCALLKESGERGAVVITGVRAAESARRAALHRRSEYVVKAKKRLINPILDWSDDEVWAYIAREDLPVCELYARGWTRIGCMLCPNSSAVERDRAAFPKLYETWHRAFLALYAAAPTHRRESIREMAQKWSCGEALWLEWLDRRSGLHGDTRWRPGEECELFAGAGND